MALTEIIVLALVLVGAGTLGLLIGILVLNLLDDDDVFDDLEWRQRLGELLEREDP